MPTIAGHALKCPALDIRLPRQLISFAGWRGSLKCGAIGCTLLTNAGRAAPAEQFGALFFSSKLQFREKMRQGLFIWLVLMNLRDLNARTRKTIFTEDRALQASSHRESYKDYRRRNWFIHPQHEVSPLISSIADFRWKLILYFLCCSFRIIKNIYALLS